MARRLQEAAAGHRAGGSQVIHPVNVLSGGLGAKGEGPAHRLERDGLQVGLARASCRKGDQNRQLGLSYRRVVGTSSKSLASPYS